MNKQLIEEFANRTIPADNWVIRKFEYLARKEGLTLDQFIEKYNPSFNPEDWDDAGSAFEAWA